MDMKKLVAAVAVAGWTVAQAAVSVTNVTVQQRWPWNGKVDIDYEVISDNADDSVFVYPLAKENDRNIAIAPRTLTGDGVEPSMVGARIKPGKHRMTWDMSVDEPTLHSSSFTVTMHAVKGGMYMVVDLSGGPTAEKYPIRYSDTPPDITSDLCRTEELWLRLCLPGTFMMGSPTDEKGRESDGDNKAGTSDGSNIGFETLHQVTLSTPFYVGIFEFTQRQYELVWGSNPLSNNTSRAGDFLPVSKVSWHRLRGFNAGDAWPKFSQVDPTSFLGLLRGKTGCLFDLPTEAQWEYACRAGTSTAFNNGKDTRWDDIVDVCRCWDGDKKYFNYPVKVGSLKPNSWGLYDMHGSVGDFCLDYYTARLGNLAVCDPKGPDKPTNTRYYYRVVRGGCTEKSYAGGHINSCRSASRDCSYAPYSYASKNGGNVEGSYVEDTVGFRVVVTPVVE